MKIYLKGFYGYKNFGDEVIFFGLLNYLQKKYNPENFVVEVGSISWIQQRIDQNSLFLDDGILDKIDFVENMEISRRFRQFQSFLGINKYKKYFKVFGGGEVLDENRPFPHDGRNLLILHRYCIRKGNFILVGGIGTDKSRMTKMLFKKIFPKANEILCRESASLSRAKNYGAQNIVLYQDFSKDVLSNYNTNKEFTKNKGYIGDKDTNQQKYVLINISPKYFTQDNLEKLKNFVGKCSDDCKKIFFPADINLDKEYYSEIRKFVPDLEIYDWTKHKLGETISLFKMCDGGIGSRLHFLYLLQYFEKNFESISNSDKVKKMISNN